MATIFHLDMDAFFVSVEELFDPALKGKPVVVGGKRDQRGVVSAASYAARKFGVHSAMPLRRAAQLCPEAIFVEGHPERYREYSHKVRQVIEQFTPKWDMASIDEAYLDLTGTERLHGSPYLAAHKLHEAVKKATGLNCSIGISTSRMVSKVASDQAKPNGILWILPGQESAFLGPLELRKLPGIGAKSEAHLRELGLRYVRDVQALDEAFLEARFGALGLALAGKSRGEDRGGWYDEEIGAHADPKSISHEHTFGEDTDDPDQLEATLARLSEMVGMRLREGDFHARTLQLKLRNTDFETVTRARSLDHGTQLDTEIFQTIRELFYANWSGFRVRLLGVHAGNLTRSTGQLDLLDEGKKERWHKALSAADKLRERFGGDALNLGTALRGRFRERVHEAMPDVAKPPKKPSSE